MAISGFCVMLWSVLEGFQGFDLANARVRLLHRYGGPVALGNLRGGEPVDAQRRFRGTDVHLRLVRLLDRLVTQPPGYECAHAAAVAGRGSWRRCMGGIPTYGSRGACRDACPLHRGGGAVPLGCRSSPGPSCCIAWAAQLRHDPFDA